MASSEGNDQVKRSAVPLTPFNDPDLPHFLRKRFRIKPRQAPSPQPPAPTPPPNLPGPSESGLEDKAGDDTSDDQSSLGGQSDSESDDERFNPFNPLPSNATRVQDQLLPLSTTTTSSRVSSFSTSFTQRPTTTVSAAFESLSPTSTGGARSTEAPKPSSSNVRHDTAIALGTVLAVLSTAVIAFLLYRYCLPVRARIQSLRGRKGIKLSERDGGQRRGPSGPSMMQASLSAFGIFKGSSKSGGSTTIVAPADSREKALPFLDLGQEKRTSGEMIALAADKNPANPFSDHAAMISRSNSASTARSARYNTGRGSEPPIGARDMNGTTAPYPFDFNFSDYNSSQGGVLPAAIMPKRAVGGAPVVPLPTGFGSGLDMTTANSPKNTVFEIPYAPVSEAPSPRSQYYIPTQRKSITPSESISNAPYSPLPPPMALMPRMPVDSRWSRNSSSAWAPSRGTRTPSPEDMMQDRSGLPPALPLSVRTSASARSSPRSSVQETVLRAGAGINGDHTPLLQSRLRASPQPRGPIIGLPSSVRPRQPNNLSSTTLPLRDSQV